MQILFLHQNFPGQFRHLVAALAAQGRHRLVALGQPQAPGLPGVEFVRYRPKRDPAKSTHRYLHGMERAVLAGQAVIETLLSLKRQGFVPDVIVAHPGWGEALYVKDVYPAARLIHFCEYYYHAEGADAGFDPAFPLTLDDRARIRTRNALHLLNLEQCDVAVAPTAWQKSLHPPIYHDKIRVIHEGIDTVLAAPNPDVRFTLPDGRVLTRQDKVVTYVARNLEPYRGFPQFIRALAQLQAERGDVHALIVGGDEVSYGSKPKDAANWREKMLAEVQLDPARCHFVGKLPYLDYLKVLQVSSAHVYLTYPFVLSWSLLEAMAAGCCVIGSDTAPVQEVIRDGEEGWLVDFFDQDGLLARIGQALEQDTAALRRAARERCLAYGIERGNAAWLELIGVG
ncbi:glycosyltransferase family 4 protein [Chitinimonas koreensis]|uniref:glycosyltransferase family 4 protein n=1 Tax=Chitinimonas koreensis TaxID=356302 RepID=UPI0004005C95|nr:glycosyltransferase family 4 protein [Chitinimonas koreensis]QNM95690.1 glycosyltransferase [Chitinimonas koreensis]